METKIILPTNGGGGLFAGDASSRLFARKDDPKKDEVVEMKTLQHTNGLLASI